MEHSASSDIEIFAATAIKNFADLGTLVGGEPQTWRGARPSVREYLLLANSLVAELSLWASMAAQNANAGLHIALFVSSAYRIAYWGAAIRDEVADAFFVESYAAIKRLSTVARKLTTRSYDPEMLIPMGDGADESAELRVMKQRASLVRVFGIVAKLLNQVAEAAVTPPRPHPARVAKWTSAFLERVRAHQAAHAEEYERSVEQMLELRHMAHRQALEQLEDFHRHSLCLMPLGAMAAAAGNESIDSFVVELRAHSAKPAKGKARKLDIAEMIASIAAHRWALRQLALLDSPMPTPTTIINNEYKTENNMIVNNPQNCQLVEDNHGTLYFGCESAPKQLSESEQLLKTFFADDDFFAKTIAAAPTCTSTNLVVTKIYHMLRVEAEMSEGILRSKPFLEALIGVLPHNTAFSVKNLQTAIQRAGI